MKKYIFISAILGLFFASYVYAQVQTIHDPNTLQMEFNPRPDQIGEIPAATVELKKYEPTTYLKGGKDLSSLTPEELVATLAAGQSIGENKTGYIEGAPARGDIMFCFDLTGSMGGELNNAKVNSLNIMSAVHGIIPDTYFGVMSHKDYVGYFSSCGYSDYYGDYYYDYPYLLGQGMTPTVALVQTAINGLGLGYGEDYAEDYSRAFYESYSDENISWRSGSKKIILAWLDAMPHDCAFDAIIGGSNTTGGDPGRNGIIGDADDLQILNVLQGMNDNNITLIVLYSGDPYYFPLWQAYTTLTGGTAVQINSDGSIPGGIDIADFIADLIGEEISYIDEITLEVCTPGFESWLTSVDPVSYTNVALALPWTGNFEITITIPVGTVDGLYQFDICLLGDGVEYGRQHVSITVENTPCILPGPAGMITGEASVCNYSQAIYCVPYITDATSYIWEYSGTDVVMMEMKCQSCIILLFNEYATSGILTVRGHNDCGDGIVSPDFPIIVNHYPEEALPIVGPKKVMQSQTGIQYNIPVIANALTYVWAYSGTGVTINGVGNAVMLDFAVDATSGVLSVYGQNNCGKGNTVVLPITVNPYIPPILGPTLVAPGQKMVPYAVEKVPSITSYLWAYSGSGVKINGKSNTVTIDFSTNAKSGILSVTGIGFGGKTFESKLLIEVALGFSNNEGKSSEISPMNENDIEAVIDVYPNPADGMIHFISNKTLKSVTVNNIAGQTMAKTEVNAKTGEMDVSAFVPGIYFIKLETNSNFIVKKITVR
jgi:hypothetical protein